MTVVVIRCASCQRDPRGQCPECRRRERGWRRVLAGRPLQVRPAPKEKAA